MRASIRTPVLAAASVGILYFASSQLGAADAGTPSGRLVQLEAGAGCLGGPTAGCTPLRGFAPVKDLAVSSDGRHVYALAAQDCGFDCQGKILVLTRDTETGALTQPAGPEGEVAGEAESLTLSRDGKTVYTAGGVSIESFRRDAETGALARGSIVCEQSGDKPSCRGRGFGGGEGLPGIDVAVSPDGRNLYAASTWGEAVLAFARASASGGLRQLDGEQGCIANFPYDGCKAIAAPSLMFPDQAAVSPDGRLVVSGGPLLVTFVRDASSGRLSHPRDAWGCTHQGRHAGCGQVGSVAFAPSGMAYVTTVTGALFGFRYDGRAHRLVQLRGAGSCAGPSKKGCVNTPDVHGWTRATVSSDGRTVYVIGAETDRVTGIRRDRRSGRLSLSASVSGRGVVHPAAIATSPDGRSVYVGSEGGIAVFARR